MNGHLPSGYLTVRHEKWPIEIDGLPIKNGGSCHGYGTNNQMVDHFGRGGP